MENLQEERWLAIELAVRGGEMIQTALSSARSPEAIGRRWSRARHTEIKTKIDKDVDDMLRGEIQRAFLDDAILSEENAPREGKSGRVWVIDPIDGTLNLQDPLFGTFGVCVALAVDNVPVLGVVFSPDVRAGRGGRIWIGEEGKQALYSPDYPNVEPTGTHVSDCAIRNHAIGAFDSGKHDRAVVYPYVKKLDHDTAGVTCVYRIASASMSLAAVATGDWDFYGATSAESEDLSAMVPILKGTGAVVTTLDGRPWTIKEPSILTANSVLHGDLLQYLNS
ncbi:MAG: hypothetical protein HYT49_00260 [Candidatus Wildermuthbacteria bacterium]|nr:hypothetical protein [Candidatus Wildermuthbacteria bacterium]